MNGAKACKQSSILVCLLDRLPMAGMRYGLIFSLSFRSPALIMINSAALALGLCDTTFMLVNDNTLLNYVSQYLGGRPKTGVARKPAPSSVARVYSERVRVGAMVLISQKTVLFPCGRCLKSCRQGLTPRTDINILAYGTSSLTSS